MDASVTVVVLAELRGDEGTVLKVYDDKTGKPIGPGSVLVGYPTIATGRNLATRGISQDESDMMLGNDLAACETELVPLLPWLPNVSANRQAAVYSLYFNVSLGAPQTFLAKWPHFLAQMAAGEFDAAATNLETSQPWASEVGPRAPRLGNLIRYG